MKRLWRLLLMLCLLVSLVWAENTLEDLLGEVAILGTWTKPQARSFLALLLADGKFQPAEVGWLEQLASGLEPVTLVVSGQNYAVPAPQGPARELLALLTKPPNMNVLFDGNADQFGQLIDLSSLTPAMRDRVGRYLIARIQLALEASSLPNAFAPVTGLLNLTVKKCDALDEERRKEVRLLLWQACQGMREAGLKDNDGNVIQAFLYD